MQDLKKIKTNSIIWPEGRRFAFSVFDDTDGTTMQNGPPVYEFLSDLGFRITKSVWPIQVKTGRPSMGGTTCADPAYAGWVNRLQEQGFEIGLHSVTDTTASREEWLAGLDKFYELFGHYPMIHANHTGCRDSIYWGDQRVSGVRRCAYNLLTKFRNRDFQGHLPGTVGYWGDLCARHIKYVRNFVYADINTLSECPYMPYHDPDRPFVRSWFASSEGPSVEAFNRTLSEINQERLEIEGGACIMYTHFANGFYENGKLNSRFVSLMHRLSSRPGWFVPVSTLLDYLEAYRGHRYVITTSERRRLERRWLMHKIRLGGTT
ncbi:MAG: hypothetical protein GX604_10150 [Actinobacteria bacterium]|nr:hypothetical protein [Actinomycetota bacterium]